MVQIITSQIAKMFLMMLLGVFLYRIRLIDHDFCTRLSNLLLMVINPLVIIVSLQTDYQPEMVRGLLISFTLAIGTQLLMIPLSNFLIRSSGNEDYPVDRFSAIYPNCGFIGIPLVLNAIGSEGVLYLTAYITVFNVFNWTHGVMLMKKRDPDPDRTAASFIKEMLKNLCSPMIFACIIGLFLFAAQIRIPDFLLDTLDTVSGMNTPMAMIIVGASAAQTSIPAMLKKKQLYLTSLVKLLFMPAIVFALLLIIRPGSTVAYTILVASACPSAASCTSFALRYGRNYRYASELCTFTTLCSLVTIPLFVFAAEALL